MIASLLNELIAEVIGALPRLFLFGAPVLAIGIVLAALADARMPRHAGRTPIRRETPDASRSISR
jgi:hypothetical protein